MKKQKSRKCKHCGETAKRYFVSACPACGGSPNISPAEARDTVRLMKKAVKKAGTKALKAAGIRDSFIKSHVVFM